jgi:dipeptidyl aminopeptidase/acylaminoacyl peptidase
MTLRTYIFTAWFHTAALFFVTVFPVDAGKRITPEAIVSMRVLQSVAVRPDGGAMVYTVNEPLTDSKAPANTELWFSDGKTETRLTNSPGTDSGAQWSPGGSQIAFLSNRTGDHGNQIYLMEMSGGEVRKLTRHEAGIASFAWSPDGKSIAYLAPASIRAEERARQAAGDDEIVFRISDHDRRAAPNKVWIMDIATGEGKQIPTGDADMHASGVAWSPDGSRLLLTVSQANNMDGEWIRSRIAVVGVKGGEPRTYCSPPGKFIKPQWKPDGSAVSFLGAAEARDPSAGILYVCTGEGTSPTALTAELPATLAGYAWLPDGKSVLLSVIERNTRYLARLDIATRSISRLSESGLVISADFSLSKDGHTIACIMESPDKPADGWMGSVTGLKRITRLNPALEEFEYGKADDIEWKAKDGLVITGVLIKPVGYEPGRRYPLIVHPHGGPESVDLNGFQIQWGQVLAAHGYSVLFPNYRGSIGRGAKYTMMVNRNFGGPDFADIIAGLDELIRQGVADPDRLGIGGWSYGGFMSAWAVTQTNRFKAAVMGVGVSNWYSLMGQTPLPLWTVQVHFETWPSEDPHAFRKNSPIEFVNNARTPTLILHGEVDPMIPLSQAKEFFRALQHLNVPSELVVYPREGHGLREPVHRIRAYARVLDWYDRYVKKSAAERLP